MLNYLHVSTTCTFDIFVEGHIRLRFPEYDISNYIPDILL